jgi:1,4-dihydroxy-2-naphthoate octaprenyltransferase
MTVTTHASEEGPRASRRELILGPMRPPFLLLVPTCVLLGLATALWSGATLWWPHVVLVFVGALASHISVNALNEYEDYRTGLDLRTERTPFSGGSGTLPRNPGKAHYALATGLAALAVTAGIGVYFTVLRGWAILPLGLLGLLVIASYTRWLTRDPLLCLIAPGLGFGPFMVMGTHFALTGSYSWTSFVASLVPFFLVSDLLLLNQFPDIEADRAVGRHHLLIALGRRAGVRVYGLFLAAAYVAVLVGFLLGLLPVAALLAMLTIGLAVPTFRGAARHAGAVAQLVPFMGRNVMLVLVTPVLLAVGLFLAM